MLLSSEKRSSDSPSSDALIAGAKYDPRGARGHMESWWFKANDPASRRAFWLRWTVWAGDGDPSRAVAEVWAIAFGGRGGHVATKASVPFERARFSREAVDVAIDGCTLTAGAARGRVESGGRSIAYHLAIDALEAPMRFYPARWMYEGPWPTQKVASLNPNARVSGTVKVDGEEWAVDGWRGMMGHTWGRGHSPVYAWGHCNAWDDGDDVVLDGFSARTRVGPVLAPMTTVVCLRHHGVRYDLNRIGSLARSSGTVTPRRWRFHAVGPRADVRGELWADTEDFVGLFYPNPDGTQLYCLNSKIAHAEVTVRLHGRAPRLLRSSRAALEIMTSDPNHGVRMYV
ncbi:MAG TPA: hypothetical protein VIF15_05830 [Polyangiaceae bacterium]|jgi:hypothetical protein